ncbi:hypothetical protein CBS63078_6739 [Aspergillus niger]|uniref:Contig An03c0020, genomic contig n=3 Tax=Aspergillus niger TaxID=5061 RepID=A2QFP2_ASPNC|nr:uncharacterized protein An03g00240 [Aspergillus niger]XP_025453294.1 uncharacterized protein BO96DRAFT_341239 [Aspergillus niger CBS 101883]RDH19659.1 hypothetical protein M747DRAFT_296442 [Aspergillus niger ATCC 13496]KAI2889765.1 hypothetical protein CBS13152_5875 [Aspergillus niger]KAI2901072.1 hypothetical protein CBS63078_6739 [Aspergillus niger]KAI2901984.1 hypothetical protein CBS11852_2550 [Aspergillus niger]KAI3029996.1 hypothetical protein CBS147347_3227 [Aspergillus niger]|eukprot:XP_001389931.1 hypothetical protein ANI_1_24034 [Aspergillus niger CBS 513.88]
MGSKPSSPIKLPGFNLPLNWQPEDTELFPNALDYKDISDGYVGHLSTQREITMMRVMNTITEKPEWYRKVFDEGITSRWQTEVLASGQDVTPRMMDYIVKELQWKAQNLQKEGLLPIFDVGVVRSDTAVSEELQKALQQAVAPLENIPTHQKDYHPGSDRKVVDLVHPSLFPLVYGCTRILPDRLITSDSCLGCIGQGVVVPVPSEEEAGLTLDSFTPSRRWRVEQMRSFSRQFQWLPCDVELGAESGCRIVSYINNLHPTEHQPLYRVVEQIIDAAIPLWERSLTQVREEGNERIPYSGVSYLPHPDPEPKPQEGEDSDSEEFSDRYYAWEKARPIALPEPGPFRAPEPSWRGWVNLRESFHETGLQVIVKLATIELTPERPEYDGGSWHLEGQLNERICATAIYYYDSQNITESTLSFRQRAGSLYDVGYEQDRHEFIHAVYGFGPDVSGNGESQITQHLGSVVCREGRLLTFPNIVQHRVSPFGLADRSRPGHRKILALFLVDPHRRIISTANVPPQQETWARERQDAIQQVLAPKLPAELQQMVADNIPAAAMTLEEAREYRVALMDERRAKQGPQNDGFETGDFSLCEH